MARRIAALLAQGEPPESVVAFTFTFTTRAAGELAPGLGFAVSYEVLPSPTTACIQ